MRFSEIILSVVVMILAILLLTNGCQKRKPIVVKIKPDTYVVDSLQKLLAEKPTTETVYEPITITETTTITDTTMIEKVRADYEARINELNEHLRYLEEMLDYIASGNDSITVEERYNRYDFDKSTKFYDFKSTILVDGVLRPEGFTWQVTPKIPSIQKEATILSVSPHVTLNYGGETFHWGGGLDLRYRWVMIGIDAIDGTGLQVSLGPVFNF